MSKAIRDVKRDSGTDSANGGWLRRLVGLPGHISLDGLDKIFNVSLRFCQTKPSLRPMQHNRIAPLSRVAGQTLDLLGKLRMGWQ